MKKWIVAGLLALGLVSGAAAAKGAFPLDQAPDLSNDVGALQRGGKLFVNYCLSCHSASFERYKRFKELGLTERQIRENLMFSDSRVGDLMQAASLLHSARTALLSSACSLRNCLAALLA